MASKRMGEVVDRLQAAREASQGVCNFVDLVRAIQQLDEAAEQVIATHDAESQPSMADLPDWAIVRFTENSRSAITWTKKGNSLYQNGPNSGIKMPLYSSTDQGRHPTWEVVWRPPDV